MSPQPFATCEVIQIMASGVHSVDQLICLIGGKTSTKRLYAQASIDAINKEGNYAINPPIGLKANYFGRGGG